MQEFSCPRCEHLSTYDPWTESARCPNCGYSPEDVERPAAPPAFEQRDIQHRLLDQWVAIWSGSHTPQVDLPMPTDELAPVVFAGYQQMLGEDPASQGASPAKFVRNEIPSRPDIIGFVRGYTHLKRGERAEAAQQLRALTERSLLFADPWIWLAAGTDDPDEQRGALETAVAAEPAHPLARDAWAVFSGRVTPSPAEPTDESDTLTLTDCPHCGAPLHHPPGAMEVLCEYCGYEESLQPTNLINDRAPLVADLQLQRRYEGRVWTDAERLFSCLSCGAQLVMTRHLARRCLYCGATNVLVEDSQRSYEAPDGLLPFVVEREAAAQALDHVQRSGVAEVNSHDTGEQPQTDGLHALYLPFWSFDGFVEARLWGTAAWIGDSPHGKVIDAQTMLFENLLIPAVDVPPRDLVGEVLPYDLQALVRFEAPLIADTSVALHTVDVEQVLEQVHSELTARAQRERALKTDEEALEYMAPHPEASQSVKLRRTYQVSGVSYQLLLLPVWLAAWRTAQGGAVAVVNGQDGKVALREWRAPGEGRPKA
jgi:DNA-directed RNA polymerase subunit RPC12/RpoP